MLDVLQAAWLLVYQVFAGAVAVHAARYRHLVVVRAKLLLAVRERYGHLREPERLARVRPVEHDIGEFRAPQRRRPLLAEHPPYRVGDVRLPAAVRPDNGYQTRIESEPGAVCKALEADYVQLLQVH